MIVAVIAFMADSTLSDNRPEHIRRDCALGAILSPQLKVLDELGVLLRVFRLQIVLQAATTADHHQQTSSCGEVLFMDSQVLGEIADPLRENGDLHRRRSRVALAFTVLCYQFALAFGRDGQLFYLRLCVLLRGYVY